MTSIKPRLDGGVWYLSGKLDDHLDTSELFAPGTTRLVVNLEGITGMTSLGTRKFRDLLQAGKERGLTLCECPSVMVDAFNCVPALISVIGKSLTIESVFVPYSCEDCRLIGVPHLVKTKDVGVGVNDVKTCRKNDAFLAAES